MCRSAVPPPEANIPVFSGHHPIALTAALCSWNFANYLDPFIEYTTNLLSLPPEAMNEPSLLHFNPQIYWLCALYFSMIYGLRQSHTPTSPSLAPLAITAPLAFQLRLPTRPECPFNTCKDFFLVISNNLIWPKVLPIEI
jgi:hypothetical protein